MRGVLVGIVIGAALWMAGVLLGVAVVRVGERLGTDPVPEHPMSIEVPPTRDSRP